MTGRVGGHSHNHVAWGRDRRQLQVVIVIVAVVIVIEVAGALYSGSLALYADAGHLFSDLAGLIVALIALTVAARPATDRQTFGFQRAEVFGALINGLIVLGVAIAVGIEGVSRLVASESGEVRGGIMLTVATLGVVANVGGMLLLRKGAKRSINLRGAYVEILGDLLGSIAVVVAAIVIMATGFEKADALASLLIAVMMVPRAFSLLRDVVRVFSESVPVNTSVVTIRSHILATAGVVEVHDVHVWAITSGAHVFSAHVVVEDDVFKLSRADALLQDLTACLSDHFDVDHSTFQLESVEHAAQEDQRHA